MKYSEAKALVTRLRLLGLTKVRGTGLWGIRLTIDSARGPVSVAHYFSTEEAIYAVDFEAMVEHVVENMLTLALGDGSNR